MNNKAEDQISGKLYIDNDSEDENNKSVKQEKQEFTGNSKSELEQDIPDLTFELPFSKALHDLMQSSEKPENAYLVSNEIKNRIDGNRSSSPITVSRDLNAETENFLQMLEKSVTKNDTNSSENSLFSNNSLLPFFSTTTQVQGNETKNTDANRFINWPDKQNSKKFTCPICQRPFGRRYHLMRHMHTVHKTVENIDQLTAEIPARKSLIQNDTNQSPKKEDQNQKKEKLCNQNADIKQKYLSCSIQQKKEILTTNLEKLSEKQLDAVFKFIIDSVWND